MEESLPLLPWLGIWQHPRLVAGTCEEVPPPPPPPASLSRVSSSRVIFAAGA